MDRPSSLLIAFFVLALGATGFQGFAAKAQTTVVDFYSIEGTVSAPDGKLLGGASVTLRSADEDGFDGQQEQEVVTGDDGSFRFDVLPASFIIEASHSCCGVASEKLTIGAADFGIHEVHLVLPAQGGDGERVTLSGRVLDASSGRGIGGARIEISNWYGNDQPDETGDGNESQTRPEYCCDGGQYESFSIISADDGTYTVSLHPGRVNIWVDMAGYDYTRAEFQLDEARELDIPLHSAEGALVTVSGTVVSSAGNAIRGASVSISPDWQHQCDGDVCYAQPVSVYREGTSSQEGDVTFYYEPRDSSYGWAETDPDGNYEIKVRGGALIVSVWAQGHAQARKMVTASDGESKTVNFELVKIPKKSVVVTGLVVDAETREAIPYAEVSGNNEQWGDWVYNQTDENGKFSFNARPGYTVLTISAYKYYWIPCEDQPQPAGEEKMASGVASDPMIWPGPGCDGQRERDFESLPRSQVLVLEAGSSETLNVELRRAPPPDAVFQGWVVNATSDEAVPNARISFYNEETREWGEAVTGEDGSYKIRVRHGYFTVRSYVDGYYTAAQNVDIGADDVVQLTLKLQPGRTSYGYCCYAYAERGAVAYDLAAGGGATPPPGAPPMAARDESAGMDELAGSTGEADGEASGQTAANKAYTGEPGNLGAYDPDSPAVAVLEGGDESEAPGFGLLVGLVALAGVALVVAQRRRN